MKPNELNLHEFYRDVALRFHRERRGLVGMTPRNLQKLETALDELRADYFTEGPVDYSSHERMVAYTMHFAPKHAIMWRELANCIDWGRKPKSSWHLNSIGPGPGSEVIGLLCSLVHANRPCLDVVGLEPEENWRQLFEIVREEFIRRTGATLNSVLTNDPANLHKLGQTVGSFVLSDAGRSGSLTELMATIAAKTQVGYASFLDLARYKERGERHSLSSRQ